MKNHKGLLVVVSGFSGVGKGTVMKALLENYEQYALSVSMTTRDPRNNEQHGREYYFVAKELFEEKVANDGFLEYTQYCEDYYGTPKDYVEENWAAGKDVILEIEIQGAMKIKEKYPETVLLFIMPPSAQELYNRLKNRGSETKEKLRNRLERAYEEAAGIKDYDYLIINDVVEDCVEELHKLLDNTHVEMQEEYHPKHFKDFIEQFRIDLKSILKGEL